MDGTLTEDGAIDFAEMRQRVGVPEGAGILAHVRSLPAAERAAAERVIQAVEREGYQRMALNAGCVETVRTLQEAGLSLGILTRNTDEAVAYFLDTFDLHDAFSLTLSRDWPGPAKPAPDALLHICEQWQCQPAQLLMVGDHVDDVLSGRRAGTHTALLRLEKNADHRDAADHIIDGLAHVLDVVRKLQA